MTGSRSIRRHEIIREGRPLARSPEGLKGKAVTTHKIVRIREFPVVPDQYSDQDKNHRDRANDHDDPPQECSHAVEA